jgi:hypothetical protein
MPKLKKERKDKEQEQERQRKDHCKDKFDKCKSWSQSPKFITYYNATSRSYQMMIQPTDYRKCENEYDNCML